MVFAFVMLNLLDMIVLKKDALMTVMGMDNVSMEYVSVMQVSLVLIVVRGNVW
jgi:hypothetical protein